MGQFPYYFLIENLVPFQTTEKRKCRASKERFFKMNKVVSARVRMGVLRPISAGLLVICLWLLGCASKQEMSALQRQVWAARRDLDKNNGQIAQLEKMMQEQREELNAQIEADRQPLRRSQAEIGAQLDRMELELGRLGGQLEEAQVMNARNGERIGDIQAGQMTVTLEMQKTIDDLQRRMNLMAKYIGFKELAATPKMQGQTGIEPKGEEEAAAAAKTSEPQPILSADEHYGKAFELFRLGQFQAAREEFTSFLERHPETDLADNAQFWLGECYYSEKKYGEAIAAYEKTIKQYPKGDKVSSALLKQGMAFLELGDKIAAEILLKKVVKGYPNTNQAKIAKSKLARIK
jgi:tol-pal system protein YbgF